MKTLLGLLLLLVALSSCQESYKVIKVTYKVESVGRGVTEYKLQDSDDYTITRSLDSSVMVSAVSGHNYVFRMWVRNVITNGDYADVTSTILIDDVIQEQQVIQTDVCGDRQILLRVTY